MITTNMLNDFRKDFNAAMKSLEEKYDCKIDLGKITYSFDEFYSKLQVSKNVEGKSTEQVQFEKVCELYNLKLADYGRKVKSGNKEYILVGLNTRAPKYPYIIQDLNSDNKYRAAKIDFVD